MKEVSRQGQQGISSGWQYFSYVSEILNYAIFDNNQLRVKGKTNLRTKALPMWFSKYWNFAIIGILRIFRDFRALLWGFQLGRPLWYPYILHKGGLNPNFFCMKSNPPPKPRKIPILGKITSVRPLKRNLLRSICKLCGQDLLVHTIQGPAVQRLTIEPAKEPELHCACSSGSQAGSVAGCCTAVFFK